MRTLAISLRKAKGNSILISLLISPSPSVASWRASSRPSCAIVTMVPSHTPSSVRRSSWKIGPVLSPPRARNTGLGERGSLKIERSPRSARALAKALSSSPSRPSLSQRISRAFMSCNGCNRSSAVIRSARKGEGVISSARVRAASPVNGSTASGSPRGAISIT